MIIALKVRAEKIKIKKENMKNMMTTQAVKIEFRHTAHAIWNTLCARRAVLCMLQGLPISFSRGLIRLFKFRCSGQCLSVTLHIDVLLIPAFLGCTCLVILFTINLSMGAES